MGKCLSTLLPASAPKPNNSSVPDVHQSSERSLKQLFDKEQQQHVGTTEELTAILEEDVCTEGQRYCIVETDEDHAEDGLFSSVDSIGSQHGRTASHKELDAVAQDGDSSSDAQETGPHARRSIEEKFLSPSQTFEVPDFPEHKEPLELVQQSDVQEVRGQRIEGESHNEELECEQEGCKEPVEAEQQEVEEPEPVETEEESHNGQHAADGRVAEQKESDESREGWDLTKSLKLSQILQVTEGAPVSEAQQYLQDAGVQANQQFNVQPEINEAVNKSVAEPSESNKAMADMEREPASAAHVEAMEAEETTGTVAITQVPLNSAANLDQQPSPPVVSEASTVEATEAVAAENNAEEQHAREDCVPGEAAADQPESGFSSNKSAADARADGRYQLPVEATEAVAAENNAEEQHAKEDCVPGEPESESSKSAADARADGRYQELLPEHPTSGETTTAAENKVEEQHDQLESAPSNSAAELVEYPASGEVTSSAERNPASGETMSAAELGSSEFASDSGNEIVAERETTSAAENKVEEQHDQLESGPESAAGNELVPTSGETTNAAENNVEELHDKLESASDAANLHVEQPTSDKTTRGSTSESMEQAGHVKRKPQAVAHEVSVENPEEPVQRVRSDDSTAEQAAEGAAKHEQEPRLQATDRPSESAAEAGNGDGKVMESSGTFETFIDAQEQFADKRGDSDEEGP